MMNLKAKMIGMLKYILHSWGLSYFDVKKLLQFAPGSERHACLISHIALLLTQRIRILMVNYSNDYGILQKLNFDQNTGKFR